MSATRHSSAVADFGFVVIVASLGGIDAVSTVVSGLPADYPVPVLIALHRGLTRTGTDPLPAILAQRTQLAVRPAHHMMDLHRPGIVVIPRGATAVLDSAARLHLPASPVDIHHLGDQLLSSAAQVAPTIAVVLTGMLSDGAAGCREVKRRGGRVLVEDPATARAASMPTYAVATGCADFVLPLSRIPTALLALSTAPGGADLLTVALPSWARLDS